MEPQIKKIKNQNIAYEADCSQCEFSEKAFDEDYLNT